MKRMLKPPGSRSPAHKKMLAVLALFRVVIKSIRRHYQSVERRAGISGAQLWALAQISNHPGIKVGELSRALAIHQSTASNLVRDLEASALVSRHRLREDQRSVRLRATAKGLALLKRAPQPLIGVLQQALTDLPEGNLAILYDQLNALVVLMNAKDAKGRGTPLSEM